MTKCFFNLSALCLVIILGAGCKKDKEQPAPMIEATAATGAVIGFLTITDEFGYKLPNQSGVRVKVDNSNPEISTTTDTYGRFYFDEIKTGPLALTIEDSRIQTTKMHLNYVYTNGDSPFLLNSDYDYYYDRNPKWTISQKSNATIVDLGVVAANETTFNRYRISGRFSPDTTQRDVVIFFGRNPTVSKDNYVYNTDLSLTFVEGFLPPDDLSPDDFSKRVLKSDLERMGFKIGDEIFCVAYGAPKFVNSYVDLNSGKTVYTNLAATKSKVITFIF